MKRSNQTLPIEFVHPLGADLFHLRLRFETLGSPFLAGQFAELSSGDSILPRPISIFAQDEKGIEFLILKKGLGSRSIIEAEPGTLIRCTAPLGTSFSDKAWSSDLVQDKKRWLLVAGGVGIAPMIAAWKELNRIGASVDSLFGFRGEEGVRAANKILPEGMTCRFATDDGSYGKHGFVTELLDEALKGSFVNGVLVCGPDPMMKACAQLCEKSSTPCFVSMETYMGCGIGICAGCAVKMNDGGYCLACQEGPVFDATHLDFLKDHHADA